ncbi:hypothetical protein [Bradyrhizobium sp. URHC0002]
MALHEFSWSVSSCRGRRRWIAVGSRTLAPSTCTIVADHPDGTCEQALDRGLLPRLSIGTLQLSILCSSIHFLPMRSFPVRDGPPAGTAIPPFGAVWSGCLSCAKAGEARHTAKRKLINLR